MNQPKFEETNPYSPLVASGSSVANHRTWFDFFCVVLYLYPLAAISSIYVCWAATWLMVGHPPQVYIDDPSGVGGLSGFLYTASIFAVTAIPVAVMFVIAMLFSAPTSIALVQRFGKLGVMVGYGGMISAISMLSQFDPGGVFKWWMD